MSGGEFLQVIAWFFGYWAVCLMPDSGHHGEGEHDERDVTMPAMP
jgi:hypothetical protein